MSNSGVYPIDTDTEVGQLRYAIGDIDSVAFDPVQPGFQDYTNFSDEELEGFLAQGVTVTRAAGWAYMRLAAIATASALDWKSDDLSVRLTERAKLLRQIAKDFFDQADDEDERGAADAISIEYPFGNPFNACDYPEAVANWNRCYNCESAYCYGYCDLLS